MPHLEEAQKFASKNGFLWDDVNVKSAREGPQKCYTVAFQGFTFTIRGESRKKLLGELSNLLILLFHSLSCEVEEKDINAFAEEHTLQKPVVVTSKTEDGDRQGRCELNDVKFSLIATSKKELKKKARVASFVLLHHAAGASAQEGDGQKGEIAGTSFGTSNDWTKADLGDQSRTSKFLALMGATKPDPLKSEARSAATKPPKRDATHKELADAEDVPEPKAKKAKKAKKEKKEEKEKSRAGEKENPDDAETDQSTAGKQQASLHQSMAGWFIPPTDGEYHTLKEYAVTTAKKYFVVMPGGAMPTEKVTAIDQRTSQKIKEDLQKGFNAAMKVRSMGVAGLGFEHYTHEQFSKNKVEGTKTVFE
eukprot:GGOE01036158.1.p1 GENE.GGOE01036158.1~~GGOE01036158.1.p1  ORF type:complete len:375 (+),score=87.27 GGOE01036158.1:36-1127(+)